MRLIKDRLTGRKFGRLKVVSDPMTGRKVLCDCDCGKRKEINRHNLQYGTTKS